MQTWILDIHGNPSIKGWSRRQFLCAALAAGPASAMALMPSKALARPSHFKLGIITDEISEDLDQALDFIAHYSLDYCELREMWQKNLMTLTKEELQRAKSLVDRHGFHVSDLASPIFKYQLPGMPAHPTGALVFHSTFADRDSEELLRKSFDLAHFFGTKKVRIFSYWRVADPAKAYPYVRDRLAKAAELAGRNGVTLLLENEYDTNVGTAKELGRMLRAVNSPHLLANWDPGNAAMMNEIPFPDGYGEIAGLIGHIHVKDVKRDPTTGELSWAPVGSGFIDWHGQLQALIKAGYAGTLSLETHFRPDRDALESARASIQGLLKVINGLQS
jgi:sugar phosphate isomerase/epimerase